MKKTKDYFTTEIKERETMSNRLNKDNAAFDYIDKTLIVLYATSGEISIFFFSNIIGISIISFSGIIGTPVGIANTSFSFFFLWLHKS